MADRKNRKGGRRKPIKGFRPGKEPAHLRKRRAKGKLGEDASWAQKKMIDAIGDQGPDEVRAMVTRWARILLATAVVLAVVGALLYGWSMVAGVAVHILAFAAAFFWLRLRTQRSNLAEMAEWVRRA